MRVLGLIVPVLVAVANQGSARTSASPSSGDECVDARRLDALERRLARAEERQRSAEAQQRIAEQQRAAVVKELHAIRRELATARAEREQTRRAELELAQDVAATSASLRDLDAKLASGSTEGADQVLARAARVFATAHIPQGSTSIAAAREALAREDLYEARRAIAVAIGAASAARE